MNPPKQKAVIWGDTSQVHFFARHNYVELRKLIAERFDIVKEIHHRFFHRDPEFMKAAWWRYHRFPRIAYSMYRKCPVNVPKFLKVVRKTSYWDAMQEADVVIVHGEGLTEKANNSACCLAAVSQLAKALGKECWLVNFSMFDAEPFAPLLRDFSYIACRDVLTHQHLASLGIDAELSFDCCILGGDIPKYNPADGRVAVVRGRTVPDESVMRQLPRPVKYNVAWEWENDNAVSYPQVEDYCRDINRSLYTYSTSFHGNIISLASGVPFITQEAHNKKYVAMKRELLPGQGEEFTLANRDWVGRESTRQKVYDHYMSLADSLRARARKNCPR